MFKNNFACNVTTCPFQATRHLVLYSNIWLVGRNEATRQALPYKTKCHMIQNGRVITCNLYNFVWTRQSRRRTFHQIKNLSWT